MKRVTLRIPDDLHEQAVEYAARERCSLSSALIALIEELEAEWRAAVGDAIIRVLDGRAEASR